MLITVSTALAIAPKLSEPLHSQILAAAHAAAAAGNADFEFDTTGTAIAQSEDDAARAELQAAIDAAEKSA